MNGSEETPYGYCHCGCGQKTKLANWTDKRIGSVKGEPYKYLNGHSNKAPQDKRFWKYVTQLSDSDCWEWSGGRHSQGYGILGGSDGKVKKAHRVSWELHYGPIPAGVSVLHKCDNPPCCNPKHLFLGTQADNMKDCAKKGRIKTQPKYGEENHYAKLTSAQVVEMRKIRADSGISHAKIGRMFGVTTMTAYRAVEGKSWKIIQELPCKSTKP